MICKRTCLGGCPDDFVCTSGVCEPSCSGEPLCGGTCCDAGQTCEQDQCVAACPQALCGSACCEATEQCTADVCCAADSVCGSACCGANEVCDADVCRVDCGGGALGCGPTQVCCDSGDLCHLGLCVTPGPACTPGGACASRPDEMACPMGQICDPSVGRCLPAAVDPDCVYVPPVGQFEPVPLFTWGRRNPRACTGDADCQTAERCVNQACEVTWPHVTPATMPEHYQSSSIPVVVDLDADCVPEIVFNTYAQSAFTTDGILRAIRGDDGSEVWTATAAAFRTDGSANPAVGDVDGDGRPDIFITGPGKNVLRFGADGAPIWQSEAFAGPEGSASVAIANLDGQGDAEIIVGAAVFDSSGALVFEGLQGRGYGGQGPISCIADLDGDGRPELVAGNTIYAFTGTVAAGDFAGAPRAFIEDDVGARAPDGYCGIADLDGDVAPEIVLVASGRIYVAQGQTGRIRAELALPGGGHGGAPNIADFDGDGTPDIATAGASNYVVATFAADALAVLWQAPTEDDSSSRTGSSVFDFDGDGRAEVVYNDEEYLRIYPGQEPDCLVSPPGPACDGVMNDDEIVFRDLNSSRTRTEYPVIADVDGDFKAEIVFATSNEANFLDPELVGDAGIEVWRDRLDNWVATRAVWNQHSYHVTNVGPAGQIPSAEIPSWTTTNSYRRNSQGDREVFCAPDLALVDPAQDTSACTELVVEVTVVNQGCLGVGRGVAVVAYAQGNVVAEGRTTAALGPGSAERVTLRANLGTAFDLDLTLAVDDDGTGQGALNECIEDNNGAAVRAVCRIDL